MATKAIKEYKQNDEIYVLVDDVQKILSGFLGSLRSLRTLIDDFSIAEENYLFGVPNDNSVKEYDKKCRKAKLFLKKEWIEDNFPKEDKYNYSDWINCVKEGKNPIEEAKQKEDRLKKVDDELPILMLDEKEMFHDEDGEPIFIEVRGERKYNKCYFKMMDVGIAFGIERLDKTIKNRDSAYVCDEDYKIIKCNDGKILPRQTFKNNEDIYLTYQGVMRALFATRNGHTTPFIKWATETLFTAQMGSLEDKTKMCSKMLEVDYRVLKSVLKKTNYKFSCVYLIVIGSVDKLRKKMHISPEMDGSLSICKYGRTNDLTRRMGEHMRLYGIDITLERFSLIDDHYNSKAELAIKQHFEKLGCFVKYKNHTELIYLNTATKKDTVTMYNELQTKYAGRFKEIVDELDRYKEKIQELTMSHETKIADMERIIESIQETSSKDKMIIADKITIIEQQNRELEASQAHVLSLKNKIKAMKKIGSE